MTARCLGVGASFVGLVLILSLPGCGDNKSVVQGRVTLDGEPLAGGVVEFFPKDGKSPSGKPGMIKDGTYEASDVPVGTVRVEIHWAKVVGKKKAFDMPESPMIDELKEVVPAKYNTQSKLVKEIIPGRNKIDFELTSK